MNGLTILPEEDQEPNTSDVSTEIETYIEKEMETEQLPDGSLALKTVTIGGIAPQIISLYSNHGAILVKALAIVYLPIIVGTALIIPMALFLPGNMALANGLLNIGLLPFSLLATIVAPAVVAKFVSDAFLGRKLDLWEGLSFVWNKSGELVSSFIATVIGGIGAILLLGLALIIIRVGGIFLGLDGVLFSMITGGLYFLATGGVLSAIIFTSIIPVLEGKSWFDAPRRSIELASPTTNAFIRLVAILAISLGGIALFGALAGGIVGGITGGIVAAGAAMIGVTVNLAKFKLILAAVLGLASKILLGPASASIPVLMYYDHKMRYENFSADEFLRTEKETSISDQSAETDLNIETD